MSDVTSIASYATALSQSQLQQKVGYAVLKKSMDAGKAQGQAAIALLEAAAQVAKSAPTTPGVGESLDVRG